MDKWTAKYGRFSRRQEGWTDNEWISLQQNGWRLHYGTEFILCDQEGDLKFERQQDAELAAASLNDAGVTMDTASQMTDEEFLRIATERFAW